MILLSLASKQIWPQVLAVHHFRPERLVLLHSEEPDESRLPAQRLKRFFDKHGPVPKGGVQLEGLSDSDFSAIEKALDDLASRHTWDLGECLLNITGGNKLMATAAFLWASRRGVRTFYLERRNKLTLFEFRDGQTVTTAGSVDGHIADGLDPVALLRCQVDASEVEREGQKLTLNPQGLGLPEEDVFRQLLNGVDAARFLTIAGSAGEDSKKGDALELACAAVVLKLGVQSVQRGLRLKVKSAMGVGTRLPHAEIDLLFSWDGRLWLVDCKDRDSTESLVEGFRREMGRAQIPSQARELLDRIGKHLARGESKALKEDLLAVRETGGLLGQVVCVRKVLPKEEVVQFARHNKIEIIQKSEMATAWRALLFPKAKAQASDLANLATQFSSRIWTSPASMRRPAPPSWRIFLLMKPASGRLFPRVPMSPSPARGRFGFTCGWLMPCTEPPAP